MHLQREKQMPPVLIHHVQGILNRPGFRGGSFHRRFIEAISLAGHGSLHAKLVQQHAIHMRTILTWTASSSCT
jgi:hypothetical protein